jgi:hypothetical protein
VLFRFFGVFLRLCPLLDHPSGGAAVAPRNVDADVSRDCEDPGRSASAPWIELCCLPPQPKHCFLRKILGTVGTCASAHHHRLHPWRVVLEEFSKCAAVLFRRNSHDQPDWIEFHHRSAIYVQAGTGCQESIARTLSSDFSEIYERERKLDHRL